MKRPEISLEESNEKVVRLTQKVKANEKNKISSIDEARTHVLDINKIDLSTRPPIKPIISPFLFERKIVYAYAKPKAGKTWWVLYCLLNVAAGTSFHKFEVFQRKVLYVDGEMSLDELVIRKNKICAGNGIVVPDANFFIYSKDEYPLDFLDTHGAKWAEKILALSKDYDVIAFDNLSSLFGVKNFSEGDARNFQPIRELFATLKANRKVVFFLHHEGKSGDTSRGSSTIDDGVDGAMRLEKIDTSSPEETSFRVSFSLYRGEKDDRMIPLGVHIGRDTRFSFFDPGKDLDDEMLMLYQEKEMSIRAIATFLNLAPSRVYRYLLKAGVIRQKEK